MTEVKGSLNGVSLCCIDLLESEQWFRATLGLETSSGRRVSVPLPLPDPVSGATTTEAICWQLDAGPGAPVLGLYQFSDPLSRLMPPDAGPLQRGIARLGFHVPDFDAAMARFHAAGTPPVGVISGEPGHRRARVRTPDGVFIDVLEDNSPAAPETPADGPSLRRVTIATPDLAASRKTLAALCDVPPGQPDDDHRAVLRAAPGCEIELVAIEPSTAQSALLAASPVPDQGLFELVFAAAQAPGTAVIDAASGTRITFADDTTTAHPVLSGGRPTPARHWVRSSVVIDAPPERVWLALNDHDRMLEWLAADKLEVTVPGFPDPAGYGAVRVLSTFGRQVVQQVTRIAPNFLGYRAIAGTPFRYHNGAVEVIPRDDGTRVDWTIHFETHDASVGVALQPALQAGIDEQMEKFRAMVEAETVAL